MTQFTVCEPVTALTVSDILIAESDGIARPFRGRPWHFDKCLEIAERLWVGRLECEEANVIMDACDPKGYPGKPNRSFGHRYALIRIAPDDSEDLNWDKSQELRRVAAFSRLVHATAIGYKYCARVHRDRAGRITFVYPWFNPIYTYVVDTGRPELTAGEWLAVGQLLSCWSTCTARRNKRIRDAIWYREHAACEYFAGVRWTLIATGIEALVGKYSHTGPRTQRGPLFCAALCKLATIVGIALSSEEARTAWKRRSSVVHGAGLPPGSMAGGEPADDLYARVELILSGALRLAIEDDSVAAHFADDAAVDARLAT